MYYHFVLQASQTLSLRSKLLPCKGATDPNKPDRSAALFWALLPQLFVQFEAQFAAFPLSLLNAHNEDTTKPPRPTNQLPHNRYGNIPYSRFWSGIFAPPTGGQNFFLTTSPIFMVDVAVPSCFTRWRVTRCVSRDFVPRPIRTHQYAAFAAATDPNKPDRSAARPWAL